MNVPIAKWGKDHWSTFAYLECRAVDNRGTINKEHMRCNYKLHPELANSANRFSSRRYPTILKDNEELHHHDDWSCFEDLESVGLVEWAGTGINPIVKFTDKGNDLAGRLRAHKSAGGKFSNFEPGTI